MQHRFRRWLRSDRTFWTLLALTLVGVTAAYYVAREAEKRQTEWVHGLERTGPAPTEPAIPDPRAAPAVLESVPPPPPPPPHTPARGSAAAASAPQVTVVSLLTTPENVTAGAMTPECTRVIGDKGPWKNRAGFDEIGGAVSGLFCVEGTPTQPKSPPIVPICDNVVVGAGAVVTKDITVPGIYAGNPAKLIRKL